jgi:hypothetical protein
LTAVGYYRTLLAQVYHGGMLDETPNKAVSCLRWVSDMLLDGVIVLCHRSVLVPKFVK